MLEHDGSRVADLTVDVELKGHDRSLIEKHEAQDAADQEVAARFGTLPTLLANRRLLSRATSAWFILFNFYRRLLLSAIIIGFWDYPTVQILSSLLLQLAYLIFINRNRVFGERSEQVTELANELLTLFTLYFLMYFTGEFI